MNDPTFQDKYIDKIICGDNLEVMAAFPDECVDLVVTSPPYDNLRDYHGYTLDVPAMVVELWRIMKPGGVIVWVVGGATINGSETGTSFRQALTFMDAGFNLHDTMIWDKGACRYPETNRYYPSFEYMFCFSKGKPVIAILIADRLNIWAGNKLARPSAIRKADGTMSENSAWRKDKDGRRGAYGVRFNIWRCDTSSTQGDKTSLAHPASFPDKLAADHIRSWSNVGGIVLDPMCGSGTTCKMALKLDRHYIGIDVSEEYCKIARERIRIENSQLKLDLKAGAE